MLCGRVRSTTVLAVEVVPSRVVAVLLPPVPAFLRFRLAVLVMVASERRRWWLRVCGGACWRVMSLVVARSRPRGLLCDVWFGTTDRVVREKSLLAWPTPTWCRLWVASLLKERRGYPSSAFLCTGGNPRASALVRAASGAFFFQGAAWYSILWTLGKWWYIFRGRNGCGSP